MQKNSLFFGELKNYENVSNQEILFLKYYFKCKPKKEIVIQKNLHF